MSEKETVQIYIGGPAQGQNSAVGIILGHLRSRGIPLAATEWADNQTRILAASDDLMKSHVSQAPERYMGKDVDLEFANSSPEGADAKKRESELLQLGRTLAGMVLMAAKPDSEAERIAINALRGVLK